MLKLYFRNSAPMATFSLFICGFLLGLSAFFWGDKYVFDWLRPVGMLHNPLGLLGLQSLTFLGGGVAATLTLVLLSRHSLFIWLAFALGWITVGSCTALGKHIFFINHLRPGAVISELHLPPGFVPHKGPGMPSGHSAEITLTALALITALGRRKIFEFGGVILALAVALSRVALGQHFPSQVGAGILLGCLVFHFWNFLFFLYQRHRQNRFDISL